MLIKDCKFFNNSSTVLSSCKTPPPLKSKTLNLKINVMSLFFVFNALKTECFSLLLPVGR